MKVFENGETLGYETDTRTGAVVGRIVCGDGIADGDGADQMDYAGYGDVWLRATGMGRNTDPEYYACEGDAYGDTDYARIGEGWDRFSDHAGFDGDRLVEVFSRWVRVFHPEYVALSRGVVGYCQGERATFVAVVDTRTYDRTFPYIAQTKAHRYAAQALTAADAIFRQDWNVLTFEPVTSVTVDSFNADDETVAYTLAYGTPDSAIVLDDMHVEPGEYPLIARRRWLENVCADRFGTRNVTWLV